MDVRPRSHPALCGCARLAGPGVARARGAGRGRLERRHGAAHPRRDGQGAGQLRHRGTHAGGAGPGAARRAVADPPADRAVDARPPRRGRRLCRAGACPSDRRRRRAGRGQDRTQPRVDAAAAGPARGRSVLLSPGGRALRARRRCALLDHGRHRPGRRADLAVRVRRGAASVRPRRDAGAIAPAARPAGRDRHQPGAARAASRSLRRRAGLPGRRDARGRAARHAARRGRDPARPGRRVPGAEPAAGVHRAVRPDHRRLRSAGRAGGAGLGRTATCPGAGAQRPARVGRAGAGPGTRTARDARQCRGPDAGRPAPGGPAARTG